jgi:hypothetical protein
VTVVAALCWYDEEPETLAGCIGSLAGVVDAVVALDGRWRGFQGIETSSPPEQQHALEAAAAAAGLELHTTTGHELWPSQVEKRNELVRIASAHGHDWVLVVDADERVESCDRDLLAAALATRYDVAEVQLRNAGVGVRNVSVRRARRLLRAGSHPRYVAAHNFVRARRGHWLAGDADSVRLAPAADAAAALAIVNHVGIRPPKRQRASELHYTTRREAVPA